MRLIQKAKKICELTLYHCPRKGKKSDRLIVKCADCKSKLDIYYPIVGDKHDDLFEIGGVIGTKSQWLKAFKVAGLV